MNYKLLIKKNIRTKYQNSQYDVQLILEHLNLREKLYKKLLSNKILKNKEIRDPTYLKIKKEIYNKKKFSLKDKNFVMKMYSKFEINLKLKKYINYKKK